MDHLVVEVVLGEAVAIARADCSGALPDLHPQIFVVQLLHPALHVVRHAPENAVAAQRDALFVGPGEHAVDDRVVDLAALPLHVVPFERGLDDARIEMAGEDLFPLGDVVGAGPAGENPGGHCRTEPELVTHLLDADFRAGGRVDHQVAHPVTGDRGIEVGVRGERGRSEDEGNNGVSESHSGFTVSLTAKQVHRLA